jgi:hypothetical protein
MYLEIALHQRLITKTGYKVYTRVAPPNAKIPFVVVFTVSEQREYSHDGFSSLSRTRVQVSCFDYTYIGVKTMVAKILEVLEDLATETFFITPFHPVPIEGSWVNIQAVFNVNEVDIYEEPTKVFHCPLDFFVWHNL